MIPGFLIKDPRSRDELRLGATATSHERLAFLNETSTRIGGVRGVAAAAADGLR
ncbi:hypothetical protein ACFQYP_19185 [Nonomuraea antimicrobica]